MTRIDKSDWLEGRFARVDSFADILRQPTDDFEALPREQRDGLRQTQVFENEVVRILGRHRNHDLVMKFDGVIGWLAASLLRPDDRLRKFETAEGPPIEPMRFLESWRQAPYLWGGLSKSGVDCSGFTQLYYLAVHGRIIPKNSRDQRKVGSAKEISSLRDHDLIFCRRINCNCNSAESPHHVALSFESRIWHAQQERGVISQSVLEFRALYEIEEVVAIL